MVFVFCAIEGAAVQCKLFCSPGGVATACCLQITLRLAANEKEKEALEQLGWLDVLFASQLYYAVFFATRCCCFSPGNTQVIAGCPLLVLSATKDRNACILYRKVFARLISGGWYQ